MTHARIDRMSSEDRPSLSNYRALHDWITKHNGRCMWQVLRELTYLEGWLVNGQVIVLEIRPNKMGWEIYVPVSSSNEISVVLAAADEQLGVRARDKPHAYVRELFGGRVLCGLCGHLEDDLIHVAREVAP